MKKKVLQIIRDDPWLEPYAEAIEGRYLAVIEKEKDLTGGGRQSLSDFASGYLYFGLHKVENGWIFREWAPNATAIYLIGTFNDWKKDENFRLHPVENGIWELQLAENQIHHENLYKLLVEWQGGYGERIPAWCQRVVQDDVTKIFSAQAWNPE
ncbi:MAG: 1,4-alpha-glucan-branching enzyme, partial [Tannerella sp.]|nr:1,4-alpha-glucan-branching enzyme [Tannerella sp.]